MKEFKQTVIKALLPHIILMQAEKQSLHGWAVMKHIRKVHGVYFGPSTIYPMLNDLENKGLLQSQWIYPAIDHKPGRPHLPKQPIGNDRPRKIYAITNKGRILLGQNITVLALVNKMIEVKT